MQLITGPPNGPVLLCLLASVVCRRRLSSTMTLPAGGLAGRRARGRPILHGGPVWLRPVVATSCSIYLFVRLFVHSFIRFIGLYLSIYLIIYLLTYLLTYVLTSLIN